MNSLPGVVGLKEHDADDVVADVTFTLKLEIKSKSTIMDCSGGQVVIMVD